MPIDYETHNQKTGHAPQAERSGRKHLRGSVRAALANVAGQIENNGCGNVRKNRYSKDNIVELGIGTSGAASKSLSHSCRIFWNPSKNSLAGSLIAHFPEMGLPSIAIPQNGTIMSHVASGLSVLTRSSNPERVRFCRPTQQIEGNAGSFRF